MKRRDESENGSPLCPGKSLAWGAKYRDEPHDCYLPHPPCMRCYADMGCVRCSGPAAELLCRKCKDWAHPAALESHGAMLSTPAERQRGLAGLREMMAKIGKDDDHALIAHVGHETR